MRTSLNEFAGRGIQPMLQGVGVASFTKTRNSCDKTGLVIEDEVLSLGVVAFSGPVGNQ